MNRKTLREFAELHAPAAMCRWQEAYANCQLRALRGDEGEADPTNRDDPANVVVEAEAEIETALAEILKEGRYTIEGRRNGTVERLQPYSMNRLRLALGGGGVIEIDHEGRTANEWSDCDVIDEGADAAKPPSERPALQDVPDPEYQTRFNEKLRHRIQDKAQGPNGYRDDMIQWARHELCVSPDGAQALWENRYNKSHTAGRYKKA
jgi:hypothetical protein